MDIQSTYTDIVEIGSGGGGTIFKAFHVRMKKYVVLKKIHDNIQNSVDIRGELDILKNLRHSYLPSVIDFIEDKGSIYTVMDYIPGESFAALLKRGIRFNQAQILKYARQLGEVLVYLHGQKVPIVHGDIKPANIMLTPEDNICLIDFNISQVKNGIFTPNMGYTPGYAAPEQVQIVDEIKNYTVNHFEKYDRTVLLETQNTVLLNPTQEKTVLLSEKTSDEQNIMQEKHIDERSDIYSVGATLYALLFGAPPSKDYSKPVTIEADPAVCSEGLAHLLNQCMAFDPGKRIQSAAEFLKAVVGVAKIDKRYKRLVLRQNLAVIFCVVGIAGCVILAVFGAERIEDEHVAVYNALISEMETLRISGGESAEMDDLYAEAREMYPNYVDAYYQKALFLYDKRNYPEMISFIENEVLKNNREFSDEEISRFYFLLADSYIETEELDTAISYYRTALKYNSYESTYYTDYAIALARNNELEEASKVLSEAVELGVDNDRLLLAQGEISGRQGMTEEAEKCFRECLTQTEDEYVRLRAYIMWSKLYDNEEPTVENLLQKAFVLEEGAKTVRTDYQATVLEQLAQTYIDLGELSEEAVYYFSAIETLRRIESLGWDTYVTHNNIGILYEKTGEYETAKQEFLNMISLYGKDYRTYKRLAFLEIEIQGERGNGDRDYYTFLDYYNSAKDLFKESGIQEDQDMEMQLLDQVYSQLQEGNWF